MRTAHRRRKGRVINSLIGNWNERHEMWSMNSILISNYISNVAEANAKEQRNKLFCPKTRKRKFRVCFCHMPCARIRFRYNCAFVCLIVCTVCAVSEWVGRAPNRNNHNQLATESSSEIRSELLLSRIIRFTLQIVHVSQYARRLCAMTVQRMLNQ